MSAARALRPAMPLAGWPSMTFEIVRGSTSARTANARMVAASSVCRVFMVHEHDAPTSSVKKRNLTKRLVAGFAAQPERWAASRLPPAGQAATVRSRKTLGREAGGRFAAALPDLHVGAQHLDQGRLPRGDFETRDATTSNRGEPFWAHPAGRPRPACQSPVPRLSPPCPCTFSRGR